MIKKIFAKVSTKERKTKMDVDATIKECLSKHRRWDPLQKEYPHIERNISIDGIVYYLTTDSRGFYVHAKFHQGLKFTTTDGKFTIDDARNSTDIVKRYMPTLEIVQVFYGAVNPLDWGTCLLCYMPHSRFDVFLFDTDWAWNEFLPGMYSYDDPRDNNDEIGTNFFNVYATLQDNDEHYYGYDISLTKSNITFKMHVPPSITQGARFQFMLKGGQTGPITILDMDVNARNIQWQKVAGLQIHTAGQTIVSFNEKEKVVTITLPQSAEHKRYILGVFQAYIFPEETSIDTISLTNHKFRIVPRDFCTRLATGIDKILQVAFNDTATRVNYSPVHGLQWGNARIGDGAIFKLPIQTLERTIMLKMMKELTTLEAIPMSKRTPAQWKEMVQLLTTIQYASERMSISLNCMVCKTVEASWRAIENPDNLFCSNRCYEKYSGKKRQNGVI